MTKMIFIALIETSLKKTPNPVFHFLDIVFDHYPVKTYVNLIIFQKPVELEWIKKNGELPKERAHDDRLGVLSIKDAQRSDSDIYICTASDSFTFVSTRVLLQVS